MVLATVGIRPLYDINRVEQLYFLVGGLAVLTEGRTLPNHWSKDALLLTADLQFVVRHRLAVLHSHILFGSVRLYLSHFDWVWGAPELCCHSHLRVIVFLADGLLCPLFFFFFLISTSEDKNLNCCFGDILYHCHVTIPYFLNLLNDIITLTVLLPPSH